MLKKNLIVIATIAGLTLIFTSNALGQQMNMQFLKNKRTKPRAVRVAAGDVTGDGIVRTKPRKNIQNPTRGSVGIWLGSNDALAYSGTTHVNEGTLGLRRRGGNNPATSSNGNTGRLNRIPRRANGRKN